MISFVNFRGVINLMAIQEDQKVESTLSNSSRWSWFWNPSKALSGWWLHDRVDLLYSDLLHCVLCFLWRHDVCPLKKCIRHTFQAPAPGGTGWEGAKQRGNAATSTVPEKWWKVHGNFILSTQSKQHYHRYPALECCSVLGSLAKNTCWGTWTERCWKWLKCHADSFQVSPHFISCQLSFFLPAVFRLFSTLHNMPGGRALQFREPRHGWMKVTFKFFNGKFREHDISVIQGGFFHANLMTRCLLGEFLLSLSVVGRKGW